MTNYFSIPYDKAIEFLQELSENELKDIYDKYNTSNVEELAELISDNDLVALGYKVEEKLSESEEDPRKKHGPYRYITKHGIGPGTLPKDVNLVKWEDLDNYKTAIWTDRFLTTKELEDYDIYPENIQEGYSSDFESVVEFLTDLDTDTLEDLMRQYDTNRIEDLATAITDFELEDLGFNASSLEENEEDHHNIEFEENDMYDYENDYDEDLDYLEDVPSDIKFSILDKDGNLFTVEHEEDFYRFKDALDSNLVESCELETVVDSDSKPCYILNVVPRRYDEKVSEEVVINSELNPKLFDNEHKMLPEVKEQIMQYLANFEQLMSEKDIPVEYDDIHLVGSNAGYLYTPESDIDIHYIWSHPLDVDIFEKLKDEFSMYTTENPLFIGENQIELNLEDGFNVSANSNRRYSLINDIWVDDSDNNEVYTEADLAKVDGYEELVDDYTQKIDDVVDSDEYADALLLKQEIRQNRSDDLANIGALSLGNVVFKELRNNGAYGKLRNYIKEKENGYAIEERKVVIEENADIENILEI